MTSSIPAPESSPEDLLAQRPSGIQASPAPSGPGAAPRAKPGLTLVLGGVVVAALLFAGGLVVGHATSASAATPTGRGGAGLAAGRFAGGAREGATGAQGGFGGGGFTSGDITAISGTTVTIKAANGTTTTVTTTPSTTVSKTVTTDLSGLKVGDRVTVVGQKDANGNVAAQAITQGTGAFGALGGARGGPAPAPTN